MVRETRLSPDMFLYPLFVCTGTGRRREVTSMPGVYQLSVDEVVKEAAAAQADGVPGVLLFGLPDSKDPTGSAAWDADAPVQSAVRALKREVPDLLVVTDVCLCEYTSHGHCGLLVDGEVVNDATVELLARSALSHAAALGLMTEPLQGQFDPALLEAFVRCAGEFEAIFRALPG